MLKKFLSSKMFTGKLNPLNIAISALTLLIIVGVFYFMLEIGAAKYADRAKPKQFLHNLNISGKSAEEVEAMLPLAFEGYLNQETTFDFGNNTKIILKNVALDPIIDKEKTLQNIEYYNGKPTAWQYLKDLVVIDDKNLALDFDPLQVSTTIDQSSSSIQLTADARFDILPHGQVVIIDEIDGSGIDQEVLIKKLKNRAKTIELRLYKNVPKVKREDLTPYLSSFQDIVNTPIILSSDSLEFLLDFGKHPEMINVNLSNSLATYKINSPEFNRFVLDNLQSAVETHPENIQVTLVAGKGNFSGASKPGKKIDLAKFEQDLNNYLQNRQNRTLEIPVITMEPTIEISEELQNRGIKELHTSIYTTFNGSTANRIHNITVGAARYNGLIIPKGKTFSFNQNLGPVDAVNGYLPELVIKSEGTIPEFGGGLCQVSSSLYRAALFAGLKITERSPHSYAVGYYAQVLGHGLDATIYPGSKDLKFVNDTPGDLLIQSYVEGTKITFNFYGTKDGRQVKLSGPTLSDHGSTSTPIYIVDSSLPPGTIKQVEKATPGFKAFWTRTITYSSGEQVVENIFSQYRTVANKYIVSPDKSPTPLTAPATSLPPLDESGMPRI